MHRAMLLFVVGLVVNRLIVPFVVGYGFYGTRVRDKDAFNTV